MTPKALNYEIDTEGLSINAISNLHYNMFVAKTYDWWYEVLPGDLVVDIGASVGAFSARALDAGAKRVYMIEPNRNLLKTAVKNVSDYIIDAEERKVFPINAAIGKTDIDLINIYKSEKLKNDDEEPRLMTFQQLVDTCNLSTIDFLKVNTSGAEFNILTKNNINYLMNQVRHIAVVVHLTAQYGSGQKFIQWRNEFLKPFVDLNRVKYQDSTITQKIFRDDCLEVLPNMFLVYITNW